jgi:hypothetical protein
MIYSTFRLIKCCRTILLAKPYLVILLLLALSPTISRAQFTTGNVVVLQTGDGSAALSSVGTQIFLKEFNTTTINQTVSTDSIIVPTSGAARLVNSGSAGSEGSISLSADSTKIVVCGYDTTAGTTGVASSTSTNIKRVIDTVNLYNSIGRAASTNSQYSGNNFRSAARGVNDDYYGAGGVSGTYYFGNTTTAATIQSAIANARVVKACNSNLYFSVGSGSGTFGIYKFSGFPTTSTTATTLFNTGSSSSPYSFAINASETIAYVADDRTTAAGGIQKWVYSSGSWGTIPADTFSVGSGQGARGLTVDFSGTYPVIYATTTDSRLIKMIDSGRSTASYIVLATAVTNTAFRSVVFAPKCVIPNLSTSSINPLCNGLSTGSITLSISGGSTTSSIAWTGSGTYTATTQNISSLVAGTYNVRVQTVGGCVSTKSVVITQPAAIADTLSTNAPICVGDTLKLNVNVGGGTGTLSYAWSGPSSFTTSTTNPRIPLATIANSGKYRLTITDANSCSRVDSIVASIDTALTINLGLDTSICFGKNLLIDAKNAGNKYLWNTGDTTQKITVTTANKYFVTVTNAKGCKGADTLVLAIDTLPVVTLPTDTSICFGKNLLIDAKNAGNKYLWNTGDTTQKITVTTANKYFVTVTNAKGCKGADTLVLAIDTLPIVSLGRDTNICQLKTLILDAGNPGAKYLWNTSDTTKTMTIATANKYFVTVTNAKGCVGSDSILVAIDSLPIADSIMITAIASSSFNFAVSNPRFASVYVWIYGDGYTDTGVTKTHTYTGSGTYTVHLVLVNACGVDTLSKTILSTTGIASLPDNSATFNLYPNPAKDLVNIESFNTVVLQRIVIYNMQGQQVFDAKINASKYSIDLNTLHTGIYSVQIQTEKGVVTRRLEIIK